MPGLATRLGYSERHLNRVLTAELGAGPLALARAHRAHTARLLIETTPLGMADVAFAAGFASVRQFNDTVRAVYGVAPTTLRAEADAVAAPHRRSPGTLVLRLPFRPPFDAEGLLAFFAARARHGRGDARRRRLRAHAAAAARRRRRSRCTAAGQAAAHVTATLRLADPRDLGPAVARVRRLLDLDADPVAVDELLGADPGAGDGRQGGAGHPAARHGRRRRDGDPHAAGPAGVGRGGPHGGRAAGRGAGRAAPARARGRRAPSCCSRRPPRSPSAAPRS